MSPLPALLLALAWGEGGGPVVVAPPQGAQGAPPGWIGMAVAELLPRALQRAGVPAVSQSDRQRAQEVLGVPALLTTRATGIRVAEALGASRLVVGSWERHGDELTLSLRLLDAASGSLSAPLSDRAPLERLATLVHTLAWDIALAGPRPPRGTRESFLRAAASQSLPALQALGQGLAGRDLAAQLAGARRALMLDPASEEAALVLGRLLVDSGAHEEARRALVRLGKGPVFARDARFLEGVALLGLGRYREADALYAELVRERPSGAALSNRAAARLRSGARGASSLLRQAVEVEPGAAELPFNLGWALLIEGDAAAAGFWLQGAVRRDPADAHGRLLLSWALSGSSRVAEAEEEWRTASVLMPALEGLRKPDLSRRFERLFASERASLVDPERVEDAAAARTHAARGESLLDRGELTAALAELTRATLLDPYAATAHRLLARARRLQGENEKAADELQMALYCREDPDLRRELAELLRGLGRVPDGERASP